MRNFWASAAEWIVLLYVRFRFAIFSFWEFAKIFFKFYSNQNFRSWDLALFRKYIFDSPYKISKRYLENNGADDPYLYGETPLTVLQQIAIQTGIVEDDVVYELGCGRGRGCFWLAAFVRCRVVGIEQIPEFVERGREVLEKFAIPNVSFLCCNLLDVDYRKATVVYCYGTSFETDFIRQLILKLHALPPGAKVITVSYPLSHYTEMSTFALVETLSVSYGWGPVDVYIQQRI